MNLKQKLAVITMDAMLVLELALCMYFGQRSGGDLTAFFLKTFLPALVVTVVVARFFIHRWQDAAPDSADATKAACDGSRA
ncbi:MAG: hypothetical protein ABIL58_20600 [Pseudomonadota bacterium]